MPSAVTVALQARGITSCITVMFLLLLARWLTPMHARGITYLLGMMAEPHATHTVFFLPTLAPKSVATALEPPSMLTTLGPAS